MEIDARISALPTRTPLEDQLLREALAMASYALASGKSLPPRVAEVIQDSLLACNPSSAPDSELSSTRVGALTWAHAQLTRLVAPAAPRAVLLLAPQSHEKGLGSIFGPIRLVQYLLVLSLASLAGVLLLGATEDVTSAGTDIFNLVGFRSLINGGFLLCAASIGASFSALFRINLYIAATTYDPKYDVSYWVQYGLGLIAGVLLATMIPVSDAAGSVITRPVLALVGGFSASLLYRVLDRLSRSIESAVAGLPTGEVIMPAPTPAATASAPGAAMSVDELQRTLKNLATLLNEAKVIQDESQPLDRSITRPVADGAERTRGAIAAPTTLVDRPGI